MLSTQEIVSNEAPNQAFAELASDEQIQRVVRALETNGIHAVVAENGEEAKRIFFELIPEGAEASVLQLRWRHSASKMRSTTRDDTMHYVQRCSPGRATRGERSAIGRAPDYAAGSVHAVTEDDG
jgi:hypothetical protein